MTGKQYGTDDDVIGTVRSHVEDLPEKSCWNGIKKYFQLNNYLEDVQTCHIFPRKKNRGHSSSFNPRPAGGGQILPPPPPSRIFAIT